MKATRIRAVVASLLVTGTALAAFPAPVQAAWGGTGVEIEIDKKSDRYVTGGGNFVITSTSTDSVAEPNKSSATVTNITRGSLVIEFECHATAGRDATQTRIVPGGCTLYKGGTAVGSAPGQSLPGPSAATQSTATVGLSVPGELVLCWSVSATYLLNGGAEVQSSDCMQ
jgi:hypothetical protein